MITPSIEEIKLNNRSRSAKLRIAEKIWETFCPF
jgi:16S rRNA C1402 N4-methylase RsmH